MRSATSSPRTCAGALPRRVSRRRASRSSRRSRATGSTRCARSSRPRRTPRGWWSTSSPPMLAPHRLPFGRRSGSIPTAVRPLLDADARAAATRAAVEGALAVIDPPGVGRQVRSAVLARARRTGGSLLGRVVALLRWLTGQQRRSADPAAYLRDWRRRGSLGRAVNPVHAALVDASSRVPAGSRAAILRSLGTDDMEDAVTRALDGWRATRPPTFASRDRSCGRSSAPSSSRSARSSPSPSPGT